MKVGILNAILKISSRISNPSSNTSLYRSVELDAESVRCCSEFGNIQIETDSTGLQNPQLIDCNQILTVTNSLPGEAEIEFTEKANKLEWKSGSAKGYFNLVLSDHTIPKLDHATFPWVPPIQLGDALQLASSACTAAAVSVGLYGITIEPDGTDLRLMSCNRISLAASKVELGTYPFQKITLRPPVPGVIAALIQSCPNCLLDVTPQGVFISGDWLSAHLPLGSNLDTDLKKTADKFQNKNHIAKVNGNSVKRFITRAKSLSDRNMTFTVSLKIDEGILSLSHEGISSGSEEYFIAEGLDKTIKYEAVSLLADMLVFPLGFVTDVVLDYLPEQQLVLRGENPDFIYIVGGED